MEDKILLYDQDKLIQIFKNREDHSKLFPNTHFYFTDNSLRIKFNKYNYIIFKKIINVKIIEKEKELSITSKTNLEIKRYLEQNYNINKIILKDNSKFQDCFNYIDYYIENDSLVLKTIDTEIPIFIFNEECITFNNCLNPEKYSKFFYDYFPYIKKLNKEEVFKFIETKKRKDIIKNVYKLMDSPSINKYKITGPFFSGKSMTLFRISLAITNIIYINLKTLKNNKNNLYKCLEMIFSACSRVFFEESSINNFKSELKNIDLNQNILNILLEIINLILLSTKDYIIIILDQYKLDNINNDHSFIYNLEGLIAKKLKIIYCSSINDNEMRDELIKTIIKYRGFPLILNEDSQNYYFYYTELYKPKMKKGLSYKLFKNKHNYSKLFNKKNLSKSLKDINNKILSKLKSFKIHSNKDEITNNNYSLSDILLFLKKIINKILNLSLLLDIISICPFKYFIININSSAYNFFVIPIFPYMIYFMNTYVQYKDCEEYFSKEKYQNLTFLSKRIKGEYFEFSAKLGIKQILKFPKIINDEIYVDQIAEMNKVSDDFEELLSELKKEKEYIEDDEEDDGKGEENEEEKGEKKEEEKGEKKEENKEEQEENEEEQEENEEEQEENEEEQEENEEEQEKKDDEEYEDYEEIKQNLDQRINEKDIEEKIRNYYKKKYANLNIFKESKPSNEQLKEEASSFGIFINPKENDELNGIDDYRITEFNNRIRQRKNKIIQIIKSRKNKNKNKREITILIERNKNNEKYKKVNGNENIFIDQKNTNGKIVDYAVLFGNRENKKFVSFQMKCYSSTTSLEEKFMDKSYIRNKLSPMLFNSIKLFNCKITEWHYFLIFYYNNRDKDNNNIGIRQLISSGNKNIKYLLYNPLKKKFFSLENDNKFKNIIELKLTNESNLDYSNYLNNRFNYCLIKKEFKKYNKKEDLITDYYEGLNHFINDLKIYLDKNNNIIKILSKVFKVENLFYCLCFHDNVINMPSRLKIFLYKKKKKNHFIGIKNNFNDFIYYDLENNQEINSCDELIDLDYQYTYVLKYEIFEKGEYDDSLDDLEYNQFIDTKSKYI